MTPALQHYCNVTLRVTQICLCNAKKGDYTTGITLTTRVASVGPDDVPYVGGEHRREPADHSFNAVDALCVAARQRHPQPLIARRPILSGGKVFRILSKAHPAAQERSQGWHTLPYARTGFVPISTSLSPDGTYFQSTEAGAVGVKPSGEAPYLTGPTSAILTAPAIQPQVLTHPVTAALSGTGLLFTANDGAVTIKDTTIALSKPTFAAVSSATLTFTASTGVLTFLPFVRKGIASQGSTTVTLDAGTDVAVGQAVTGTGVAVGTTVSAITGTALTLSAQTTAAIANGFLTFRSEPFTSSLTFGSYALSGFAKACTSQTAVSASYVVKSLCATDTVGTCMTAPRDTTKLKCTTPVPVS